MDTPDPTPADTSSDPDRRVLTLSRRGYLAVVVMHRTGCAWPLALEAVATTALEHPDWDMDEGRTLAEWRTELGGL